MSAIQVNNLVKKFNGFTAVDAISFEIREGEIFGLLGPNGAGKTTTISILATILKQTSGSARVWNHDIMSEKDKVRKSIGIVFQDPSLDDELTGRENLEFHGRLYGMEKAFREERINEVLKLVELEDKAGNLVRTYSGGMKRRLEIARGLMHTPRILFLDEPTIGLDPQTRRKLWEYIKKINQEEKVTMILTTHYMEEADFLCDRIAIIDHGKIISLDTAENLKASLGGDIVYLESPNSAELKSLLEILPEIKEVKLVENGTLDISVVNGDRMLPRIIQTAQENNIIVSSVILKRPSLEDVFIHYTGRTIREEEGDEKSSMRLMRRIAFGGR